jgi:hypothetical protein
MVVGDPIRSVTRDLHSSMYVVLDHDCSLRNRSFDEARPHGNRTAKDSVQYATWIVVVSAARARAASRVASADAGIGVWWCGPPFLALLASETTKATRWVALAEGAMSLVR